MPKQHLILGKTYRDRNPFQVRLLRHAFGWYLLKRKTSQNLQVLQKSSKVALDNAPSEIEITCIAEKWPRRLPPVTAMLGLALIKDLPKWTRTQ
jgi:hypothetical protein